MSPRDYESGRRAHERVRLPLEVAYRSTGSFLVSYSVDLSRGGLFVQTDAPLPVGSELDLQLSIPGVPDTVSLRGRVVWVQDKAAPGKPEGMGIQFQHVEERLASLIDSVVRQFQGMRALLACADPRRRNRYERMLHRSLAAEYDLVDFQEAPATLDVSGYDLVVVEIGEGEEAALRLIERVRLQSGAAIVVLASHPRWRSLARDLGVQEVLSSPPPLPELRAAVLRAVGRPSSLRGSDQETE